MKTLGMSKLEIDNILKSRIDLIASQSVASNDKYSIAIQVVNQALMNVATAIETNNRRITDQLQKAGVVIP